ncbi:transporter substrate-binding domain-containing protein, partial [Photobacterium sp. OFAV2-7]|uniref:ATP-binding protein n=1 Tax=Photobacterium sp. OFAV2-7 TaxID=2917748 RepID=UPI001EF5FF62
VITKQQPINQFQELTGKRIAVEQGFALMELLPSLMPKTTLVPVSNSLQAIKAVQQSKADGYIGDAVVLSDLLRQHNDPSLELSILPGLPTNHLHFATQKGKHKLLSRINFALEDIKSQSLTAIYNQWLNPGQINMFTNYGQLRLSPEERSWLDKNPYITIGVHRDWAPYDYLNTDNIHSGLTADLLNIISNELGVKFEISSNRTYSEINRAFHDGELMMLSALPETPTQDKLMYFSAPYVDEPWVLFAPAEEGIDSLLNNSKLTVGIIADTSGSELLSDFCSNCSSVSYINQVSAFQALQKEEVDRVLTSLHHASPLLQSDYLGQFKMVGQIEDKNLVPLHFAVNFRQPILLNIINKALDSIPPKEMTRLENKWLTFEYQEGLAPKEVAKWAGIITLLVLTVIITITWWNRKMAEEILQRKTAEKRARRAERRLQHLADNLDGVVLQHVQPNPDQPLDIQYTFVSAGVKELLGISATSIKLHPEHLLNLLDDVNMSALKQSMREATKQGHWDSEQKLKYHRGQLKWIQFKSRVTPHEEGGFYWNTVVTDISLLKQQQLALEHARQKAEIATAAKSQFLATISHEVRTPISGILGLLELMADQPLNDELVNLHGGLTQSARNMLHIVNDVLDYSKIEAGKLDLNPTNIEPGKVLARIIQPQSIHAQQKNLAFKYWQDPRLADWLLADDIRLHQILNNFLNNAIKFTEQGTIGLAVDVLDPANSELSSGKQTIRFTVSDTGIGISPEQQKNLFKPFEQADQSTSRRFGGTGLGLAIAHKLVEQMDGAIQLSSQLGKGSEFSITVTLPLGKSEHDHRLSHTVGDTDSQASLAGGNSLIIGYFMQREALYRYLQHLQLTPVIVAAKQLHELRNEVSKHQPRHIFIAMSIWQQLKLNDQWLEEHFPGVNIIIINQNPMLSPEPLGQQWCLSVNPLLPDNLSHVLTMPVSSTQSELIEQIESENWAESRESAEANGRLILIAEDHPVNQQVISKQLKKIGLHADIVDNGLLALEAIRNRRYGLLLTDCHMPEMDGYTLSATLRQQERRSRESSNSNELTHEQLIMDFGPTISHSYQQVRSEHIINGIPSTGLPIIALTANAIQGEDSHCFEMGMSDFLVKPVSIAKLKQVLLKWLHADPVSTVNTEDQGQRQADDSHSASEFHDLFSTIDQQLDDEEQQAFLDTHPQKTSCTDDINQNESSSSAVLDEQKILLLFEDQEVVSQLMEEFKHNHQQDFRQLNEAIEKDNQQDIKTIAHRMKGASQMLECDTLAIPLATIEKEAERAQFSADSTAYLALREATAKLLEEDPQDIRSKATT